MRPQGSTELGPVERGETWHVSVLWSPAALVLWFLVALAALAAFDAARLNGKVMRGVTVAGYDLGGRAPDELDAVFDDIEAEARRAQIGVALPVRGFALTGAEAGLTLRRDQLRDEALRAGRSDGLLGRLGDYVGSLRGTTEIGLPLSVDEVALSAALDRREPDRRGPVNPTLRVVDGEFAVLPGSDGSGVDASVLARGIEESSRDSGLPITIAASQIPLPSTFTNDDLQSLVDDATRLTSEPIVLRSGESERTISVARLRRWVKPTVVGREVRLSLDRELAAEGLQVVFEDVGERARNPRLAVLDSGRVEVVPAVQGRRCCAPDTIDRIERALGVLPRATVDINFITEEPRRSTEEVTSLGITEVVASFTTKHASGEPRVKNIHRISDMIRGELIPPGESFSINEFIGPRTESKGFVSAPTIIDGVIDKSIGGGISQFATTFFNAAFKAGLDIPAYQPHSIYIKRYPYGKEATLSFPEPDLRIRNNTPYGILLWPTYTGSSITMTLYSTKFVASVTDTQKVSDFQQCKVVTTTRTRTFLDGQVKKDVFTARYLPKEGVRCDGKPTAGATTTVPPSTRPRATVPEDDDAGGHRGGVRLGFGAQRRKPDHLGAHP